MTGWSKSVLFLIMRGLDDELDPTATLRERLEQHRAAPVCAACHVIMDPIGFSMENYNAVGQWREEDNGHPIDATGEFPDGTTFNGAKELATVLQADPKLQACIAEHMYVYAMGRGAESYDHFHLDRITENYTDAGGGFRDLIKEIVMSESFRKRRGEEPTETSSEEGAEQ